MRRGGRTGVSDGEAGRGGSPWPLEGGVGAVKVLVGSGWMVILGVAYVLKCTA